MYEMRSRGQKHLIGALICVGFRNTTKSKSKLTLKLPLQIYVINIVKITSNSELKIISTQDLMTLPITVEKIAHKNVLVLSMQHVKIRLKDNMSSVQPDLEH